MRELLLSEYIKSQRERRQMTQEALCAGICDVSTLSRLERGKQTPSRDTVVALLHRLGLPHDRFFALVSENDREIRALKRDIQAMTVDFEKLDRRDCGPLREAAAAKLARLEEITEADDAINRQYILSTQVTLGTPDGPYTPAQRRRLLEQAIRMTVPGFRLDKVEEFQYRLEEMTLINKLARTYSMEGKREEAIGLYGRLLQYIEKNGRELENYVSIFCLVANNYAINLTLAERYKEALELAERGQRISIQYGDYMCLPSLLATQAECQFFLGDRKKSADLYIRAGYLLDIIEDKHNLEILRKEVREHLGMELPC